MSRVAKLNISNKTRFIGGLMQDRINFRQSYVTAATEFHYYILTRFNMVSTLTLHN